jgi:hypothetical protein
MTLSRTARGSRSMTSPKRSTRSLRSLAKRRPPCSLRDADRNGRDVLKCLPGPCQ